MNRRSLLRRLFGFAAVGAVAGSASAATGSQDRSKGFWIQDAATREWAEMKVIRVSKSYEVEYLSRPIFDITFWSETDIAELSDMMFDGRKCLVSAAPAYCKTLQKDEIRTAGLLEGSMDFVGMWTPFRMKPAR